MTKLGTKLIKQKEKMPIIIYAQEWQSICNRYMKDGSGHSGINIHWDFHEKDAKYLPNRLCIPSWKDV